MIAHDNNGINYSKLYLSLKKFLEFGTVSNLMDVHAIESNQARNFFSRDYIS